MNNFTLRPSSTDLQRWREAETDLETGGYRLVWTVPGVGPGSLQLGLDGDLLHQNATVRNPKNLAFFYVNFEDINRNRRLPTSTPALWHRHPCWPGRRRALPPRRHHALHLRNQAQRLGRQPLSYRFPERAVARDGLLGDCAFSAEIVGTLRQDKVAEFNKERKTSDWRVVNLRLQYQPSYKHVEGLKVACGVDKLFDNEHRDHLNGLNRIRDVRDLLVGARLPNPGRNLYVTLVYDF